MKKYLKEFIFRGLVASSGGPIVYAIVMLILYLCNVNTTIDGLVVFKSIISVSLMAFIIAGASIIWQIERLGLGYAILIHGSTLYICYASVYFLNNWIKRELTHFLIFSVIFVICYILVWLIIYLIEKQRAKIFNKSL